MTGLKDDVQLGTPQSDKFKKVFQISLDTFQL